MEYSITDVLNSQNQPNTLTHKEYTMLNMSITNTLGITTPMNESNIKIMNTLLDAGYSPEKIRDFTNVEQSEFDNEMEIELAVRKRIEARTKTTPTHKRTPKAA